MNVNIDYDPEAEEITFTYDNCMVITVTRTSDGTLRYSKNIQSIGDDSVYDYIKNVCELTMNLS